MHTSPSFRSFSPLSKYVLLLVAALPGALAAQNPHPITPAEQAQVDSLIKRMTLQQKLDYIGGTGFAARAVPELGIPALEMSDGPYGTRSNSGFPSTTYAAGISLASSWDPALAARVGGGIGRDARARGVHFMLGPGVNIYRSPLNGRNFEYFGEDPFLASAIAVGYIDGMQEQGVSATVKHYLGNNSEFLRHDSNTVIDNRTVREIYLPAFEAAVTKAHVGAVMDSYNLIDGEHATQNSHFNIDVLRKDWNFPGVLMSDWDATYDALGAAKGGLDIEMPTGKFMNYANLAPAVQSGKIPEAEIDLKIRHILDTAMSFGWLGREQRSLDVSFLDAQSKAAALDSAREGAVLLKNDHATLPLDKTAVKTILVVGPDAYPGVPVGGGSAGVVPFHGISALEGISSELGANSTVLYDRGLPTMSQLSSKTVFSTEASGGKPGVTLESFTNRNLSGTPASTTVQPHIRLEGMDMKMLIDNIEVAMAMFTGPAKSTSHRLTGFYTAAASGSYIVALEDSGEGSGDRVFVDGKKIIDDWEIVRAFQPHVTLQLDAGPHKIVVEEWQKNQIGGHLLLGIAPAKEIVNTRAVQLAAKADAVVITAGYDQESESEGGDRTFDLPFGQDELINAIAAANPRTIVDVTAGGNVDSQSWLEHVPALLQTWYAGQEGGHALAEILFGDVNPSGHLPATFEKRAEDNPTFNNYYPEPGSATVTYKEGLFVGYRGYEKNGVQPLFPFGFGLSYTTFQFSNLKVQKSASGDGATATFDLTNTGSRAGAEVAQLYLSADNPKVPEPRHELKGFQRVQLNPGETQHVTITLDERAFDYWNEESHKWLRDSEKFTVSVGDSVQSLPLQAALSLR